MGETSQVLNLLRGLNSKYQHTIPAITAKHPPHTFLSTRSYLLLEERYDKEHAKAAAHHALVATGSSGYSAPSTGDGGSGSSSGGQHNAPKPPATNHGSPSRSDNRRGRGRGRGRGASSGGHNSNTNAPRPPQQAWTPGLNLWTGMVQAWSMPWRIPGAGVLGSRPGLPSHQAYYVGQAPQPPAAV